MFPLNGVQGFWQFLPPSSQTNSLKSFSYAQPLIANPIFPLSWYEMPGIYQKPLCTPLRGNTVCETTDGNRGTKFSSIVGLTSLSPICEQNLAEVSLSNMHILQHWELSCQ